MKRRPNLRKPQLVVSAIYWLTAPVIAWLCLMQTDGPTPVYEQRVSGPTAPVGEITRDFRLRQPIEFTDTMTNRNLVLRLRFATYTRHDNPGTLRVGIRQRGLAYHATLRAADISDGEAVDLAVPDLGWQPGEGHIVIEGIDGMPGSSVTVWADTAGVGKRAIINGSESMLSVIASFYAVDSIWLVARTFTGSSAVLILFIAALLLGIHALLAASLLSPPMSSSETGDRQQPD